MDFIEILIWICAASFFGAAGILGFKIYSLKNLSKEGIYKKLIDCGSFFPEISEKFISPAGKAALVCIFHARGICARCKKKFRKFSDNMHGRKRIKNGGMSGYWEEVNGYKNELNGGASKDEEKKEQ
ncbi:MAG: hypothetical protein PHC85_02675 [Candidatus Pacebacteria bacterium]|nr:hypothetical protein [Candidatus Paceibacterota bacterium]